SCAGDPDLQPFLWIALITDDARSDDMLRASMPYVLRAFSWPKVARRSSRRLMAAPISFDACAFVQFSGTGILKRVSAPSCAALAGVSYRSDHSSVDGSFMCRTPNG